MNNVDSYMMRILQSIANGMIMAIGLNVMLHAVEVSKDVGVRSKYVLVMVDHPVEVEKSIHEHVTLKTAQVSLFLFSTHL